MLARQFRREMQKKQGIQFTANRLASTAFWRNCWVYRLENMAGQGPWRSSSMEFRRCGVFKPSKLHAMRPDQDFSITALLHTGFYSPENANLRFACTSLAQMMKWVKPGEFQKLKDLGYRVVKYKVDWAAVSKNQCFYNTTAILEKRAA